MHKNNLLFYYFKNKELNELYISMAIRVFAFSMISVFIPIYLIKLGYSIDSVLIFYATVGASHALMCPFAAKIAGKVGLKHSIFFSTPIMMFFYLLIYTLPEYNWPLPVLGLISGISASMFWMGFHTDFAKNSDKKQRGKQYSIVRVVIKAFQVLGPITGALFLTFIGFKALFATVAVLLMVSTIPLFFSKDMHDPLKFKLLGSFHGQKLRDYLGFAGIGIEGGMQQVIWPIFIFFAILKTYTSLGLVTSLSILFSLLCSFVIGYFADVNRRLVLRIGAFSQSLIWIVRAFVKTTWQVFIIDSIYGAAFTTRNIGVETLSYDKANEQNVLRYTVFREITINFSRAILFLVLLAFSNLLHTFIFGVGGSLMFVFF